jgi:biliverdin reductase
LLGGLHQAIRRYLPAIGEVFYARYATLQCQNPAPQRWTYHRSCFGFPLTAALSRSHRLQICLVRCSLSPVNLAFGTIPIRLIFRFLSANAQLQFQKNGLMAAITNLRQGRGLSSKPDRSFVLHGDRGTLHFEGEVGNLVQGKRLHP